MIEFGARLSLKDNMYATLQKNLKMQQQFTEQVKRTNDSVKNLGKAKANPTIQAKDNATSTVNRVKEQLKAIAKTVVKPFITVKDKATSTVTKVKNGLKAIGKAITKPFVTIRDRASPLLSKLGGGLKKVGGTIAKPFVALKDGATAGLSKIGGLLKSLAKGATIAIGLVGAGATAILGGSISEGAKLEQSIGGVETLFKGDASTVLANANMAYQTAGLSANAYMEQVTSTSASLLQSLGGDTAKSAQIADMAIIDMADNANKMGTSMDMIQNAYQGFAKQNYTMLDNLKLGYGGTEAEMKRLLKDAQKLTGQEYDIDNLSDVYNAIHAIQEDMGITGTTAEEASKTFTGSFNAMKASVSNVFGALAIGGDVEGAMTALVETASTFLFNNAIPMIGRVITSLPEAISTGIANASPKIREELGKILPPSVMNGISTVINTFKGIFVSAMPVVQGIIQGVCTFIQGIMPTVSSIFTFVGGVIQRVLGVIGDHMGLFQTIVSTVVTVVTTVWSYLEPAISSVVDMVLTVVDGLLTGIEAVFDFLAPYISEIWGSICEFFSSASDTISSIADTLKDVFQKLYDKVSDIFSKISDAVSTAVGTVTGVLEGAIGLISDFIGMIGDAISTAGDFIGSGIDTVAGFFGFAYGKDRVPYDNYPAILHQGEKVLTRNQADQYDRRMSTRGVQLTQNITELHRDDGNPVRTATSLPQEVKEINAGKTTVNIEKLADTVVIEKEADVDKVVEDMITKFRKLVPNMP